MVHLDLREYLEFNVVVFRPALIWINQRQRTSCCKLLPTRWYSGRLRKRDIADMLIHDMTQQASIDLLARIRLGRLACAHEGQPYITPIYCAYDDNYLYSFSTLGQKIAWMRANPLVCVEADELVSPRDWSTVIVFGRYEELPETREYEAHRKRAYDLLQRRPMWWEPGFVKTVLDGKPRPMVPVYFRIHIDRISGHRGVPDTASSGKFCTTHERPGGWLERVFGYGRNTLP